MSGFLTGALGAVWAGWSTLTERGLHPLDGARLSVLAGLPVSFFFNSSLSDHVGGVVSFKVGRLELFDAPRQKKG